MKFTTTETYEYDIVVVQAGARYMPPDTYRPLESLPKPERETVATKLLESLSDEARARVTGNDPTLDETDGAHPAWWRGHDRAAEKFHEATGGTYQELRDAIRAAGYDPDEVGAAEVIEKLSGATLGDVSKPYESIGGTLAELESAMASAHGRDYTMPADTAIGCIMMLIEQRDTARAQLREWEASTASSPGEVDHWRGLAKAACDALGLDFKSDHLSPSDVTDAASGLTKRTA